MLYIYIYIYMICSSYMVAWFRDSVPIGSLYGSISHLVCVCVRMFMACSSNRSGLLWQVDGDDDDDDDHHHGDADDIWWQQPPPPPASSSSSSSSSSTSSSSSSSSSSSYKLDLNGFKSFTYHLPNISQHQTSPWGYAFWWPWIHASGSCRSLGSRLSWNPGLLGVVCLDIYIYILFYILVYIYISNIYILYIYILYCIYVCIIYIYIHIYIYIYNIHILCIHFLGHMESIF